MTVILKLICVYGLKMILMYLTGQESKDLQVPLEPAQLEITQKKMDQVNYVMCHIKRRDIPSELFSKNRWKQTARNEEKTKNFMKYFYL